MYDAQIRSSDMVYFKIINFTHFIPKKKREKKVIFLSVPNYRKQ